MTHGDENRVLGNTWNLMLYTGDSKTTAVTGAGVYELEPVLKL